MASEPPHKIFISYRRIDTQHVAGRIVDRLKSVTDVRAFMDVVSIPPGRDFTRAAEREARRCDLCLVLIGRTWLSAASDDGVRRLDDPDDLIVAEIAAALGAGVPVLPVLVDGAAAPRGSELPRRIRGLARINGIPLNHVSFDNDFARLAAAIDDNLDQDPSTFLRFARRARRMWTPNQSHIASSSSDRSNQSSISQSPTLAPSPDGQRSGLRTVFIAFLGVTIGIGSAVSYQLVTRPELDLEVLTSVPVGNGPLTWTFSPDGTRVYIANSRSNTVSVIDTDSNTVVATIPVGAVPTVLILTAASQDLYVLNSESNSVSIVDTTTNIVSKEIATGSGPVGMALAPSGQQLYVLISSTGTLDVVDVATSVLTNSMETGGSPCCVALSPDGRRAYVPDSASGELTILSVESGQVLGRREIGDGVNGMLVTPDGRRVFTTDGISGSISVANAVLGSRTESIPVGSEPFSLAITPDGKTVYVTSPKSNTLFAVDVASSRVVAEIVIGNYPWLPSISFDGDLVYVPSLDGAVVDVVDSSANSIIDSISLTPNCAPGGVAVSPGGRRVYVLCYSTGEVVSIG